MDFRRRQQQTKKEFYRRIADIKKCSWAAQHQLQDEDNYKAHFIVPEQDSIHDLPKNKKIAKNEYKAEQRLRNRVAAQESRERHRSYVEQLQRKVKLYEEMLRNTDVFCRNCKKSMSIQIQETQSLMSESICSPEESSKVPNDVASEQALLNSYLDEQIIRIDNQGSTSPFSIFFILCMVAVVAIFSFNSNQGQIAPRLLSNYQSTLNQLINHQEDNHYEPFKQHPDPLILQTIKPQHRQLDRKSVKQIVAGQPPLNSSPTPIPTPISSPIVALNQTTPASAPIKSWTKYGKYMCSEPQLVIDKKSEKSKRGPEFLLLRTGKNVTRSQKKKEGIEDEGDGQNFKILPREWERLQISSCFLGQM